MLQSYVVFLFKDISSGIYHHDYLVGNIILFCFVFSVIGTTRIFDKPRKRKRQRHIGAKVQCKKVKNADSSKGVPGSEVSPSSSFFTFQREAPLHNRGHSPHSLELT